MYSYLQKHVYVPPKNTEVLLSQGFRKKIILTPVTNYTLLITHEIFAIQKSFSGFPGDAVVGNLPANAGHTGSSPGLGRSHMPQSSWASEPQLLSLRV